MMSEKVYYSFENEGNLLCAKCNEPLVKSRAQLTYLGHAFPVEIPICPKCKMAFIPEELALGRILDVEKSLEDK